MTVKDYAHRQRATRHLLFLQFLAPEVLCGLFPNGVISKCQLWARAVDDIVFSFGSETRRTKENRLNRLLQVNVWQALSSILLLHEI